MGSRWTVRPHLFGTVYFALCFSSEAKKNKVCPPLAGVQGVESLWQLSANSTMQDHLPNTCFVPANRNIGYTVLYELYKVYERYILYNLYHYFKQIFYLNIYMIIFTSEINNNHDKANDMDIQVCRLNGAGLVSA